MIISAIDSYKGCMTSHEANAAAREGLKEAFPEEETECFDVSDGGEGFLEAMRPDEVVTCHVHDALMRWTDASFGIKNGVAIIEVAKAVGLGMIEPEQRNPLVATSYGVSELMAQAMARGCSEFVVGLGGSATSDCGLGMLKCLRHVWQTRERKMWYDPFDTSSLKDIKVTIATDVTNPLCGENGAARVFAPQKGADADMVEKLERRALTFSRMAARHQGRDMSGAPGAGAAGGLGYAFMEFMDATVVSGAELVMESSGLADAIGRVAAERDGARPRFVVTGEGSADRQTLMGKWPAIVLKHAKAAGIPVVLMAGKVTDRDRLLAAGFTQVVSINDGQLSGEDSMDKSVAAKRLKMACEHCNFFPKQKK